MILLVSCNGTNTDPVTESPLSSENNKSIVDNGLEGIQETETQNSEQEITWDQEQVSEDNKDPWYFLGLFPCRLSVGEWAHGETQKLSDSITWWKDTARSPKEWVEWEALMALEEWIRSENLNTWAKDCWNVEDDILNTF